MAAASYDDALRHLLAYEGGYADHPHDPGGPTKYGITLEVYRKYVKPDATASDIRAMKVAQAKDIYRRRYWNVLRCDELPAGLDYALFDYGVNSGILRATKVLQRLLGLPDSGQMGAPVIAAAKAGSARDLIARLCDERLAFLKSLRTWPVFGAGWARRVNEVRRVALTMADNTARTSPRKNARGAKVAIAVASGGIAPAAYAAGIGWPMVFMSVAAIAVLALAGWFGFSAWRKWRGGSMKGWWKSRALNLRALLKGWRTIVFGSLVTISGIAAEFLESLHMLDLAPLLPPEHAPRIIAAIGLVTVLLRLVTTGRVGQKDC
jgi:lysozyme family protein